MSSNAHAATIADRYELRERVGQGGCGVVYRASDRHTGQPVAVKMLSHATRQDPSFVERLVREQQALQALAGTHAVAVVDLCRANSGELCLVMEWLEGIDLEQQLTLLETLGTPLGVDELWRVIEPVLLTLEKAHELGIVHRDIKPANIFILSENRGVRLLDFGFSRLKSSATLTAADTVMGSPSYIAPEAWQHGSKAIEKQADLYASGVIVFRALAGRVPFQGASLVDTMKLVTTAPRPSLCALRADLPKVMDSWVEHALAVDPERRFQHASSFLEALAAALRGHELPPHTLAAAARHPETAPPPKTSAGERQNAISLAFGRAASLLKRVASSLSRAPTPPSEPLPDAPSAPPPPVEPTPQADTASVRAPEPDSLIAELLPTSLPPRASYEPEPLADEVRAALTPARTIAIDGPSDPPEAVQLEPAPEELESATVELESATVELEPAPVPVEPAPVPVEPAPVPVEPAPVEFEPAPPELEPVALAEPPAPASVPRAKKPPRARKRSRAQPVAQASQAPAAKRAASRKAATKRTTTKRASSEQPARAEPSPARAPRKRARKAATSVPDPGDQSASPTKRARQAKKTSTAATSGAPKPRNSAAKQTTAAKRAPARTAEKRARKPSHETPAQTSRRSSK